MSLTRSIERRDALLEVAARKQEKTNVNRNLRISFLVVSLLLLVSTGAVAQSAGPAAPLGTGFTYQGQLRNAAGPVNGTCDLQFSLWDAAGSGSPPAGGNQVGGMQTLPALPVTNGLFTVVLNDLNQFGDNAFVGEARWLQIAVRCPAGSSAYATLSPRQAVTPGPMALSLPGLYTRPNAESPNIIGGYAGNSVAPGAVGGAIGGGGLFGMENKVGQYGTVSGGSGNSATGSYATAGGGHINTANSNYGTVGGGDNNYVAGAYAVVSGGSGNSAVSFSSAIGGGYGNSASGEGATAPGGIGNVAQGDSSFAAGNRAKAWNNGAFVWADSTNADFGSTGINQFLIRASGGVGVNTNAPSRALDVNGVIGVFDGGNQSYWAGLATEVGSQLVEMGINDIRFGSNYDTTAQGGLLRVDARSGENLFGFYGRPAGETTLGWLATLNNAGRFSAAGGFHGYCRTDGNVISGPFCNQDVAETFATAEQTAPGDVVALVTQDATAPAVRKATGQPGELLVGVVSTDPGLVFDNGKTYLAGDNSQLITANRAAVAALGRVPVKVSLEHGPIAVGDPLAASATPGAAMKATQAGQIIGYALQSSEQMRDGRLLMWLQVGTYLPDELLANAQTPEIAALQSQVAALQQQNAALAARLDALEQAAARGRP
jgi:hypothetical protein